MAEADTKAQPDVKSEAAAVPEAASPLASADAGKHDAAKPDAASEKTAAEAKAPDTKADTKADGADKTAAQPETKPDTKSESKPDSSKSAAESDGTAPPETKADAKPELKPDADKTGDKAKPEGEAKPEVKADTKEAPAEAPAAPPVYEALKLPDNIKLDSERIKKFDELIGKTELATKADHGAMGALRQDLAALYVEEIQRIGKQVEQHQRDVWNRLIEQRVNDLKNDPVLGGNRIETTLGNAKYALESMIPGFSKDEAKELIAVMDAGGVSHHRLMIKALNGLYELLREPEPIPGQLPLSAQTNVKEAGKRGWYDQVDGVKAAS